MYEALVSSVLCLGVLSIGNFGVNRTQVHRISKTLKFRYEQRKLDVEMQNSDISFVRIQILRHLLFGIRKRKEERVFFTHIDVS